jgi:hypothetical protein
MRAVFDIVTRCLLNVICGMFFILPHETFCQAIDCFYLVNSNIISETKINCSFAQRPLNLALPGQLLPEFKLKTQYGVNTFYSKGHDLLNESVIFDNSSTNHVVSTKPANAMIESGYYEEGILAVPFARKSGNNVKLTPSTTSQQQNETSAIGYALFLGINRQYYHRDFMQYFRGVTTFVIDFDFLIKSAQLSYGASWGGGKLYDSLFYNNWHWQPMTNLTTSNYTLSLGYAVRDNKKIKIIPYAGIQSMILLFKPGEYWQTPEQINPYIRSKDSFMAGAHFELKSYGYSQNGFRFSGAGIRVSYAYSVVNFHNLSCSFHQVKITLGYNSRKVLIKR